MRRTILYVILIIILIGGSILLWQHFDNKSNRYSGRSMEYNAVPVKSMIILRIPDVGDFYHKLEGNSQINENFKKWTHSYFLPEDPKQLEGNGKEKSLSDIIKGKQIIISFNTEGKENIGSLTIFSIRDKTEKKNIINLFNNYSKASGHKLYISLMIKLKFINVRLKQDILFC